MAIWQTTMFLVSKDRVFSYTDPDFLNTLNNLKQAFPEEKSWCNSIRQYGHIDSTCIEIGVDQNMIEDDITVRIDLRTITPLQLESICNFAATNELRINYNGDLYNATMDNMIRILRQSDAYRFISDPEKYLRKISKDR